MDVIMRFYAHNRPLFTGILLTSLFACSADEATLNEISVPLPELLIHSKIVDKGNLTAYLSIDDNSPIELNRNGDNWSSAFTVSKNETHSIYLAWIETYRNQQLLLANVSKVISVGGDDIDVTISNSEYVVSHDDDKDEVSNISERENGSNPFVSSEIENKTDALIPKLGSSTISIDGSYEDWQQIDTPIQYIDNLMRTENGGADLADGIPLHYWSAIHDDNYLYIVVVSDDESTTHDSESFWDDDNLNIYFDGNYSHGNSYDGFDDRHMMIPLMTNNGSANISSSGQSRIAAGTNSADIFSIDSIWATGVGTGPTGSRGRNTDIYEIRLDLSKSNIQVGHLFGIDMHLDDDDDGGARDSKWAWFHPSRVDTNVDQTFSNPSAMAAVALDQ